jgi:hypothetical protein
MELEKWWNLYECVDRKRVINTLKKFKKEGKIDYSLDGEVLCVEDIDLDEDEIEYLVDIFEENDVFTDSDRDDDDFGDFDDYEDYDDDDY